MAAEPTSGQTPATGPTHDADFRAADLPTGSPGAVAGQQQVQAKDTEREQQMYEVAERIGGALGTAVRHARGVSGRVRGGLELVRGRAADKAARLPEETSEAAFQMAQASSRLTESAGETFAGWKESARRTISRARRQADEMKAEYPLQMIVGLAAAFFVIGVGVRLWRSGRG